MQYSRLGNLAFVVILVIAGCSDDPTGSQMKEDIDLSDADGSPMDVLGLWDNPVPTLSSGSTVVFTGYSNSSQSARTFINQFASSSGLAFVNCALGSNALENWVSKNLAADCDADNVSMTMNMIATQGQWTVDTFGDVIQTELPKLYDQLKARFPNAVHAFYPGEPAHWVDPSRCPRICEPLRYLTGVEVQKAVNALDESDAIIGPYLHSGVGEPNKSGIEFMCEDFRAQDPGCSTGVANQHPSDSGQLKVAQIYDMWLQGSGGH